MENKIELKLHKDLIDVTEIPFNQYFISGTSIGIIVEKSQTWIHKHPIVRVAWLNHWSWNEKTNEVKYAQGILKVRKLDVKEIIPKEKTK